MISVDFTLGCLAAASSREGKTHVFAAYVFVTFEETWCIRLQSRETIHQIIMSTGKKPPRIIFIVAWSGVGKTTVGDFLSTYYGAHHIDGDDDMRRPDVEECKSATDGLVSSFNSYWFKDTAAPSEFWNPYFQLLCNKARLAATEYKDKEIVVSFSVYRREARDFIRDKLSDIARDILFLKLECDVDVIVRGQIKRLAEFMALRGETVQDYWNKPPLLGGSKAYREIYGEWSFENYKKKTFETTLAGMEPFGDDEKDFVDVDVSSRDAKVFDRVAAALALPSPREAVDMKKLAAIQEARWSAYNKVTKKLDETAKE